MNKICYIVGAGSIAGIVLSPRPADLVIAADGGFAHLQRMGVRADLLVGDFDSLDQIPAHPHILRHAPEKDDTDMLLAVREGLVRGFRLFVLCGGTGGRADHTYANYQVLSWLAEQGARGYLLDASSAATAICNDTLLLDEALRGYISVFAHGGEARGVTLRGLKYPLEGATLSPDVPLGVSNAFLGSKSTVSVDSGTLLVLWDQPAATFLKTLDKR